MKKTNDPDFWLGFAEWHLRKAKLLAKKAIREKDKKERQCLIDCIIYTINQSNKKIWYFYRELYAICDKDKAWKGCHSIGTNAPGRSWDGNFDPPNWMTVCSDCDRSFRDDELIPVRGSPPKIPYHKPLRKRS